MTQMHTEVFFLSKLVESSGVGLTVSAFEPL